MVLLSPEEFLADGFVNRLDLPAEVVRDINAKDEMYLSLRDYGVREVAHRMDYFRAGYRAWIAIQHAVATAGRTVSQLGSFLDFACGYGRTARFIVAGVPPERVWVSDIDKDATTFVAAKMGVHGVPSCTRPVDLDLGRKFEMIFVGSLFSHLPERTFGAWLKRLYDMLEPAGLLLFSTHGMQAFPEFADPSGFHFHRASETTRLELEEYGSTAVTPEWLRNLAEELSIGALYSLERDLWYKQDLHLAVRQPDARLEGWTNSPVVYGGISNLSFQDGWARISGNASLLDSAGTLHEITLEFGKAGAFSVPFRPAVADPVPGDPMRHFEWQLEGAVEPAAGRHALHVLARVGEAAPVVFDADLVVV